MIASENIVSPKVQEVITSDLHGRYAEGLPGKRYYQGCGDFDDIESLGIALAQQVFNCNFANIQSTSGTVSNIGALKALAKPGDKSRQSRPQMVGTSLMLVWVPWDYGVLISQPIRGMKIGWSRMSMRPAQ